MKLLACAVWSLNNFAKTEPVANDAMFSYLIGIACSQMIEPFVAIDTVQG